MLGLCQLTFCVFMKTNKQERVNVKKKVCVKHFYYLVGNSFSNKIECLGESWQDENK